VATKLIELAEDGILVEVEVEAEKAQPISGGFAEKVEGTLKKIHPMVVNTCLPVIAAWKDINKEMSVKQAEIELGFSFEGEGNLYITKSKAQANLTVKLILQPQDEHK